MEKILLGIIALMAVVTHGRENRPGKAKRVLTAGPGFSDDDGKTLQQRMDEMMKAMIAGTATNQVGQSDDGQVKVFVDASPNLKVSSLVNHNGKTTSSQEAKPQPSEAPAPEVAAKPVTEKVQTVKATVEETHVQVVKPATEQPKAVSVKPAEEAQAAQHEAPAVKPSTDEGQAAKPSTEKPKAVSVNPAEEAQAAQPEAPAVKHADEAHAAKPSTQNPLSDAHPSHPAPAPSGVQDNHPVVLHSAPSAPPVRTEEGKTPDKGEEHHPFNPTGANQTAHEAPFPEPATVPPQARRLSTYKKH